MFLKVVAVFPQQLDSQKRLSIAAIASDARKRVDVYSAVTAGGNIHIVGDSPAGKLRLVAEEQCGVARGDGED